MPWRCCPWRRRRSDPCWPRGTQHCPHVGPASVCISCCPCSTPVSHQIFTAITAASFCCIRIHISFHLAKPLVMDWILYHTACLNFSNICRFTGVRDWPSVTNCCVCLACAADTWHGTNVIWSLRYTNPNEYRHSGSETVPGASGRRTRWRSWCLTVNSAQPERRQSRGDRQVLSPECRYPPPRPTTEHRHSQHRD